MHFIVQIEKLYIFQYPHYNTVLLKMHIPLTPLLNLLLVLVGRGTGEGKDIEVAVQNYYLFRRKHYILR